MDKKNEKQKISNKDLEKVTGGFKLEDIGGTIKEENKGEELGKEIKKLWKELLS